MATLILLNKTELPKGMPSEALVAVWDKGSVPDGYCGDEDNGQTSASA